MGYNKRSEREAILKNIGLDPDDIIFWVFKWQNLRNRKGDKNSKTAKYCSLTFSEYVQLAIDAGLSKPDQIGTRLDQYQMGRIGDVGNYELGNCRFITTEQNIKEKLINGGQHTGAKKVGAILANRSKYTHIGLKISSDKQIGLTKYTHEHIAERSNRMSKQYSLISPDGNVFVGKNLTEFCKLHDLKQPGMALLCSGGKMSHKGWTGRYLNG